MKKLMVLLTVLFALLLSQTARGLECVEFTAFGEILQDGESHVIDTVNYVDPNIFPGIDPNIVWGVVLDPLIVNTPGTHLDLVEGGVVSHIVANNNSTATVYGGEINGPWLNDIGLLLVENNARIDLVGTDFVVTDADGNTTSLSNGEKLSDFGTVRNVLCSPWSHFTGRITGTLADGSGLNCIFFIDSRSESTADIYIVLEPAGLLTDLTQYIVELNLQNGISNSLDVKLESAIQALDDINENNDIVAINSLQAFINAVEAQRGNKISEQDADYLISSAQQIIDLLNNQ